MALGLTCIVRILIVHAEVHTLLLNAGFFSYMFFYSFYQSWLEAENKLDKLFGGEPDQQLWPATKALFIVQKSNYFYLAAAHVLMYYSHVYRQATWKTYQATAVDQEVNKQGNEEEGESALDGKVEDQPTKSTAKSKKGSKGGKSSKKQQ